MTTHSPNPDRAPAPAGDDSDAPNPSHLPVEPEFAPMLPPAEPEDPGMTPPHP